MRAITRRGAGLLLAAAVFAGCTGCTSRGAMTDEDVEFDPAVYVDAVIVDTYDITDEFVPLGSAPAALNDLLMPVASGTSVKKNGRAVIDYSNTKDGYVMVDFTGTTSTKLKVQVKGPTTTYTYDLPVQEWTTFPLSDGNGSYTVTVFENTTGTKYATVLGQSMSVTLADEFAPFLRPNQYVDYSVAPNTVAKAVELANGETEPLKLVELIYDYVVGNFTYDRVLAQNVKSGYLPDLDKVLDAKTGICFDYAALMTAMLRSQGVPCKLVVGYAGTAYHAWVSVWTEETGWIDGAIFFDGKAWQRMDPTFASSANSSEYIMKYIGDGSHYTAKYLY